MNINYVIIVDPDEERGRQLRDLFSGEFDFKALWTPNVEGCTEKAKQTFNNGKIALIIYIANQLTAGMPLYRATQTIEHQCYPKEILVVTRTDHSHNSADHIHYLQASSDTDLIPVIGDWAKAKYPPPKPPCQVELHSQRDLVLEHQLLTFPPNRSLSFNWLGKILRRYFPDCTKARIFRLTQGFSGSLVVAVQVYQTGEEPRIVLKLGRHHDLESFRNGVSNWGEIRQALNPIPLRSYALRPLEPIEKSETDPHPLIVSQSGILGTAYEFLGAELGGFMDLQLAYCGGNTSSSLIQEIVGQALDVLSRAWYLNPKALDNDLVPLWSAIDRVERSLPTFPPYALTRSKKSKILSVLEQLSVLGNRISNSWWLEANHRIEDFLQTGSGVNSCLSTPRRLLRSSVHGDLNCNNIIYCTKEKQIVFIDFATYQPHGHTMQDFANLETQLLYALMDRDGDSQLTSLDFTPERLSLWQQLSAHLLPDQDFELQPNSPWATDDPSLQRTLELVQLVRQRLTLIHNHRQPELPVQELTIQYMGALLYHTLRCIGYDGLSPFKRILAVHNSWRILRLLDDCKH